MPRDLELSVRPDVAADPEALRAAAANAASVPAGDIADVRLLRRVLDARRGVRFRLTLRLYLQNETVPPAELPRPPRFPLVRKRGRPVVIVGDGPAGIFAALRLAERGVPAVILERGKPVQARRRDLATHSKQGMVNPESNYCFGEGGAGTYSDGKLYTRTQKRGPVAWVLEQLVAHGAPLDVLVDARPHIGSNRLPQVVTALRQTLTDAGVETRFECRVTGLLRQADRVVGVQLAGDAALDAAAVVLATGHSARDVYTFAAQAGAALVAKPFAVGIRVEHPQPLIDRAQYGADAGRYALPAAAYRLAATVGERGVFSFCMCPGGWIVPAATEPEAVVVNGMSLSRRDSPFANSGIVVALEPADVAALGYAGATGGIALQEALEHAACRAGGGAQVAPAQRLVDFIAGRASADLPRCSYRPGVRATRLDLELPPFLSTRLRTALKRFAHTIRGYDSREAIVVGVETRSSSPVRIVRDAGTLASPELGRLYPCGEGAGYAGGIVSAALDGLVIGEAVAAAYDG